MSITSKNINKIKYNWQIYKVGILYKEKGGLIHEDWQSETGDRACKAWHDAEAPCRTVRSVQSNYQLYQGR